MSSKGKGKRSTNGDSNGTQKRVKNSENIQYEFSPLLQNQQSELAQVWKEPKNAKNGEKFQDINLIRDPFQVCVIDNVIANHTDTFKELIEELKDVEMCDKNNDLYKFKQSVKDLKHLEDSPHVTGLKNFLQTKVKSWLENVTGIQLNDEMDLFCAKYR